MSKCENCIHFDMCAELHAYYHKCEKEKVIPFMCREQTEKLNCDHYKDKSLCVDLPCRCKDCEYAKEIKLECETVYKCIAEIPARLVTADDFCQYAERKLEELGK